MSSTRPSGRKLSARLSVEMLEDRTAPAVHATTPVLTVQNQATVMLTADFNRDGFPDRAIVSKNTREVVVLLGRDGGDFQEQFRFSTGSFSADVLVTDDFTNNGFLDLAIVSLENNQVLYLYGQGDGTFYAEGLAAAQEETNVTTRAFRQWGVANGPNRGTSSGVDGLPIILVEVGRAGMTLDTVWYVAAETTSNGDENSLVYVSSEVWESAYVRGALDLETPSPSSPGTFTLIVSGPGLVAAVDLAPPWGLFEAPNEDFAGIGVPARPRRSPLPVFNQADTAGVLAPDTTPAMSVDSSALSSFDLLLDEIFQADRLDGLPGSSHTPNDFDAAPPCVGVSEGCSSPEHLPREEWERLTVSARTSADEPASPLAAALAFVFQIAVVDATTSRRRRASCRAPMSM